MLALSFPPCPSTPLLFIPVLELHQKALKWQKDWEPTRVILESSWVISRMDIFSPVLTITSAFCFVLLSVFNCKLVQVLPSQKKKKILILGRTNCVGTSRDATATKAELEFSPAE